MKIVAFLVPDSVNATPILNAAKDDRVLGALQEVHGDAPPWSADAVDAGLELLRLKILRELTSKGMLKSAATAAA